MGAKMDITYYKLLLRYEITSIESRIANYFSRPTKIADDTRYSGNKYIVSPSSEIIAFINYEKIQLRELIQSRFGLDAIESYRISEKIIDELVSSEYKIQKKVVNIYQTVDGAKSILEIGFGVIFLIFIIWALLSIYNS